MANISEVVTILTKSIPFRREFNLAMKESKETPQQWLARVKTLAELCSFGQCQNLCILDKFLTGFDTEIIKHLCSTAEYLDISTALKIIKTYSKRRKCDVTETTSILEKKERAQKKTTKFVERTKPAISEVLLVKCEDIVNDDENDESRSGDFPNEIDRNTFDDVDDKGNSSDSSSSSSSSSDHNSSKDSDFRPSDYDKSFSTPRVKRKYVKKQEGETGNSDFTQKNNKTKPTDIVDPTAPKKKRKYTRRAAVKEKETFECDYCHYTANHKCHLAKHMLIHLNQKSFVCHECGKGFNMLSNLNAHLRRHAGDKPHVCEVCKATFLDKTKLKLHIRTHTGERPFGCTICGKGFIAPYHLKAHMRSHTGEKPFKCDQCQRSFTQSSSLSLHKKKGCMLHC